VVRSKAGFMAVPITSTFPRTKKVEFEALEEDEHPEVASEMPTRKIIAKRNETMAGGVFFIVLGPNL